MKNKKQSIFFTFILFLGIFSPIFIYINRFLVPDFSFDTINYHLFIGQRAAHNFLQPFNKSEFFPAGAGNFAPFWDMLFYFSRSVLGYRVGTVLSLILYLLTTLYIAKIILLFFKDYFQRKKIINAILFVNSFFITGAFFELATYFTDIFNIICVVIGVYYLLLSFKENQYSSKFYLSSFLLGISLYGKLTNGIFIVPLVLLYFYLFYKHRITKKKLLVGNIIVFAPFLLYGFYLFLTTHNPLYPLYNGIFKSPYYALNNFNFRYLHIGPENLLEQFTWPVISFFRTKSLGEIESLFYDYKLHFYFIISLITVVLFFKKIIKLTFIEKIVFYFFLSSYFLWWFFFGYQRYAFGVEIMGSIILIIFYNKIPKYSLSNFLKIIIVSFLIIQNIRILQFNLKYDYSWRPTLVQNFVIHKQQLPYLNTKSIDSITLARYVKNTDFVVNCAIPNSGYDLLSPLYKKPLLMIDDTGIDKGFIQSKLYKKKAWQKFLLLQSSSKNIYQFIAFAVSEGLDVNQERCLMNLKKNHFTLRKKVALSSFLGYSGQKIVVFWGTYSPM